ncbi:FAD-binding oxidoreductase [Alicyclobacillus ferrooxydans]|uniref:D-lactate dehydrogenase (cytochrome) n=1 Tax=Alicyclobacillus ferrooxydans TaxID=471514 RepID=A0A0N8PNU1_9BACL|nr:2-hydroxy-acid oxidase [Alicyclobacillus ferrooxydans]
MTGSSAGLGGEPGRSSAPRAPKVVRTQSVLEQHGRDFTYHEPHLPHAVVYPESTAEVSLIVRFAADHDIPIVPFGVGSSLEGHIIPIKGGISLDMSRMNRIVEFRPNDFVVRVEPGVTRSQLNEAIQPLGLFFPVDPGADATLGGMAATNASGTNAVRYGAMRENVKGLEVVLADGRIVKTGGMAVKSSAGYNLTGMFVGSEGTLGIFTSITLKLHPIPESIVAARAVFPDIDAAGRAAVSIVGAVPIGRIELVDPLTIAAVNIYKGTHYEEKPTLFLEFSGSVLSVGRDIEIARELCEDEGCESLQMESDSKARAQLWEARHSAAMALMAMNPGKKMMTTDVCVPITELPGALRHARETMTRYGFEGSILGHVGDGNYHAGFTVDPDHLEDMERLEAVNSEIVRYALNRGGTCTGEHGLGLGKGKYLEQEFGSEAVVLMRQLKQTLDPMGILNPGKGVDFLNR